MDLAWMSSHIDSVDEFKDRIVDKIEDMSKLLDKTIQTSQKISTELRPGLLDDLGLIPAIEWLTQDFQNRTGMECALQIQCSQLKFSPGFTTAIFRIAQEGLTNVARHSQATEVNIIFRERGEDLELIIEDNGRGITEHELSSPFSIGIIGMHERLRPFDGRLDIKGISNEGTVLKISIPKSEAVGHD
jgi:two-component system sensor histidine kinase UhpB